MIPRLQESKHPMRRRRPFLRSACLTALAGFALLTSAAVPAASHAAPPEDDAPPTWRFRKEDKKVKVVVVAGSIGAWQKQPYHQRLENMCANVEVKNLSKVGQGAYALKRIFVEQVMKNWNLDRKDDSLEHWLIFQAPLNSVGMPEGTNHHMRDLFERAHGRGWGVIGLTLSPWGDLKKDKKRWGGADGLESYENSKLVVDFMMGRITPKRALGSNESKREKPGSNWSRNELPDIAIDLYDSPLRDKNAATRDVEKLKELLAKDSTWKRATKDMSEATRAAKLQADAELAAQLPQWFLREELRSFDHIHPNEHGHEIIAELTCPSLPESWGCSCPPPPK